MSIHFPNNSTKISTNLHPLEKLGLTAILVLNDSGLPIYVKDYGKSSNSDDDVVLSAFISSLTNFVKIYDKETLTGFSTQTKRFFVKVSNEIIYCLVLNENVFDLGNGDQLKAIFSNTLDQLIKNFTIYYKMTRTADFIEKNFLENFEKQIEIILSFNFKKKDNTNHKETQAKSLMSSVENEFLTDSFNYTFLKNGILGLFILNSENQPVLIRDYGIGGNYSSKADYYQRIVLTIKQFNHSNLEPFTDIGIGPNRITLKVIKDMTICVIISDSKYWTYNSRSLNDFINGLLRNIEESILRTKKFTYDFASNSIQTSKDHSIDYKLDNLLYSNLKRKK